MNNTDYLLHLLKQRVILQGIVREADPASGIAFMVRRGVARDNDEVADDMIRRPWATIECCNMGHAYDAVNLLLQQNMESIKVFMTAVERDTVGAQTILKEAQSMIQAEDESK